MTSYVLIAIIWAIAELVPFIAFGIDKLKAKKGMWRIPEATLLALAFVGPLGALIGMYLWHHKTKKPRFFITVPLFLILRGVAVVLLVRHFGLP